MYVGTFQLLAGTPTKGLTEFNILLRQGLGQIARLHNKVVPSTSYISQPGILLGKQIWVQNKFEAISLWSRKKEQITFGGKNKPEEKRLRKALFIFTQISNRQGQH